MGLSNVIKVATTGLHATQAGLGVIARNVANQGTEGYTAKSLGLVNEFSGSVGLGVRVTDVTREVDLFVQNQLRLETSTLSALEVKQQFLERIDQLFGVPGGANSLDTLFNSFSQSLQELTVSPEDYAAREAVIGDAQVIAQQLQSLSDQVQNLRQLAEDSIGTAIAEVNGALQQLVKINEQLSHTTSSTPPADLLDERDKFLKTLSDSLEIKVKYEENGRVSVFSQSGNALLEGTAVTLSFDQRGDISAYSSYDDDPAERGVGTITLTNENGYTVDLIRNGAISSGRIGAWIELRDEILVEAQAQLDELAHGLAKSFSDYDVAGTPVTDGFEIDTDALQQGNPITLTYTDVNTSTTQTFTFLRVDDPSLLPLSNDATPNPNDTVVGIDFSGGVAVAAASIGAALPPGITVSNPSGNVIRFVDDTGVTVTVDSLSATFTSTAVQDEGLQLPLFVDGISGTLPYTGNLEGTPQKIGFASRISVNAFVLDNNELLVRHTSSPETPIGDPDRPLELLARLSDRGFAFSPNSGIGQSGNPYTGSVLAFSQRVVSYQTGQADLASRELASQEVVTYALKDRFDTATGVDIDKELSNLIALQNAYAANARVIQTAGDLMRMLLDF